MTTINKLLSYRLLQFLLFIFIINGYKLIPEESTVIVKTSNEQHKIQGGSQTIIYRSTSRVLAEKSTDDKEKSVSMLDLKEIESVSTEESQIEKESDWTSGLSEEVIEICNEYVSMGQELKKRVFLNNDEFRLFLNELQEKKNTVEVCAPQLVNKEEEDDVRRAKVLQYYSETIHGGSIIKRIKDSINFYFVTLRHLNEELESKNENDKINNMAKTKIYKHRIKMLDPHTYILIEKKLDYLKQKLSTSTNEEALYIVDQEKKHISQASRMCQVYMELSESLRLPNNEPSMKEKSLYVLYNMEKVLDSKVPDFCNLYN